jgi:hypothetical protein
MRWSLVVHGAPVDSYLFFPLAARVSFIVIHVSALLPDADTREGMEQSKNIEEP